MLKHWNYNRGKGKHFDPVLVDAFLEIQGRFRDIAETYSDHDRS